MVERLQALLPRLAWRRVLPGCAVIRRAVAMAAPVAPSALFALSALLGAAAAAQTTRAVPGGYDPCANPNSYRLPECQRPAPAPAPRPQLAADPNARVPAPGSRADLVWQQGSAAFDRNDFRRALPLYEEGAGLGDPRAMTVLGHMYREGQGVPVDKRQAAAWYERGAAAGHRAARFSLADMLESADGIARDVPRAARLYEQSARQGFPEAQFALGISYEFGQGVPRNRLTATQWLDRAAAQGDGRAHWFSSWLKSAATPQFSNPDQLRDYVNAQVDARMRRQMGAGNSNCAMVPWVCSRERAEAIWKSEYHPPNTPNPYRN